MENASRNASIDGDALQLQALQNELTQRLLGVERIARHLVSNRTLGGVSLSLPAIHMSSGLWVSRRGHIDPSSPPDLDEICAFVRYQFFSGHSGSASNSLSLSIFR